MHKTLVVIDDDIDLSLEHLTCITFDDYLAQYPKLNEPRTRVINLCNTDLYLSRGNYCSLLAEARQHKVLPSVRTINALRDPSEIDTQNWVLSKEQQESLAEKMDHEMMIYFGVCEYKEFGKLAKNLFEQYPAPILKVVFSKEKGVYRLTVEHVPYAKLTGSQRDACIKQLQEFTQRVWRSPSVKRKYRWDMAILVNPDEQDPPSNKEAIKRFVKAAAKFGIHAEVIGPDKIDNITQYDALFIRETTSIDHYTYRLAHKAEKAGLVVIDDPVSILRCCNKVFLHDAFSYNHVPSPKTQFIVNCDEEKLDLIESQFSYPVILKMPEGSFSRGVFKVSSRDELRSKLQELFKESALVLVQEYLYTEYDWRLGVLNGRVIYACRYYMARNHWQIYNHSAKRFSSGDFETLPTFEVPRQVLNAALKATGIIGQGLYGVDIKQKDNHVYVIEVNDNPSIEHKVEDAYLGDELYMQIMSEFANRLESRGK